MCERRTLSVPPSCIRTPLIESVYDLRVDMLVCTWCAGIYVCVYVCSPSLII